VAPGKHVSGALIWSNVRTGEQIASIGYEASLENPEGAWVRLHYSANGQPADYRVRITSTPCHYGGRRWWWKCPQSGHRIAKLYLPPGATIFAARKVYRLAYRSQRVTALDRSHDRQRRLYRKPGADYDCFEQAIPPRPKGMHRKTYQRLTAELYNAMEAHEGIFALDAFSLLARLMKKDAVRARCNRCAGRNFSVTLRARTRSEIRLFNNSAWRDQSVRTWANGAIPRKTP
jgi:hypothetical protein